MLVDTSVWSLAFRREAPPDVPEVEALRQALDASEAVVTTGVVLLELLQGFVPPRVQEQIVHRFSALVIIEPELRDYAGAAALGNDCRRVGVKVGAIDSLIAQLAIKHDLVLLTTDRDFEHIARVAPLKLWTE
jgi:predicted nucleic acid-binding protein